MVDDTSKEDKIYKPDGDIISRSAIVQQSIDFYKQAYDNEITDICDFSVGSEIRTLHESIAVEVFALYRELEQQAKMKFVNTASGNYLDELACEFHLKRNTGTVAKGMVTFETTANVEDTWIIPKNTIILGNKTGYEYILQSEVQITQSDTPVNGIVWSKIVGSEYNADAGTLTTFKDLSGIRSQIKVTNPTAIMDGTDTENDADLRKRILTVKRQKSYGTIPAYEDIIRNELPDIHDVQFVYPDVLAQKSWYPRHYKSGVTSKDISGKTFDEIKEAGLLCEECTAVVFVNSYNKPASDNTVDEVEYILTQQDNLVVGQHFHVEKAVLDTIYFSMHLFVTNIVDENLIFEHLTAYFDGGSVETQSGAITYTGFNINQSINKSDLLDVLERIPGVHQVGFLRKIKYNKWIPTDISQWNNNGTNSYTYLDSNNYEYQRTSTDEKTINYWGTKNFLTIDTVYGKIFQIGKMSDADSTTDSIFQLTQTIVNG